MSCPCGSGAPLGACCGPQIDGSAPAPTAEALMRSRYTAFTQANGDYIVATQHPSLSTEGAAAIAAWARRVVWVKLTVFWARGGGPSDERGQVSFEANSFQDGEWCTLKEVSSFSRQAGAWRYDSGEAEFEHRPVERNAPCPCGSGRKYKACHA